ncbi:MAG: hypothetical protein IJC49_06030 [Clostridia bacterium]|nr:hypothetical protein [Clostridia bacterium]
MKRIDLKELKEKRTKAIAAFCVFMVLFLAVLILPLFSHAGEYENLYEKEIEVSNFRCEFIPKLSRYGSSSYRYFLTATDGYVYNLTGDFDYGEVVETLTKGTVATIKWYEGTLFTNYDHAEVVTVNGKEIVSYDNDEVMSWWGYLIVILVGSVLGFAVLWLYLEHLDNLKTMQEKRDRRIEKKYGKKRHEGK